MHNLNPDSLNRCRDAWYRLSMSRNQTPNSSGRTSTGRARPEHCSGRCLHEQHRPPASKRADGPGGHLGPDASAKTVAQKSLRWPNLSVAPEGLDRQFRSVHARDRKRPGPRIGRLIPLEAFITDLRSGSAIPRIHSGAGICHLQNRLLFRSNADSYPLPSLSYLIASENGLQKTIYSPPPSACA
jgi:hypothetical protein